MTTGAVIGFDSTSHVYTVDGQEYPSTNQVIREGRHEKFSIDPWLIQRGSCIHEAIFLQSQSQLDLKKWSEILIASIPEQARGIIGRVKAAFQFIEDYIEPGAEYEKRLYHQTYGYCGTADIIGTLKGSHKRCVVDWKSTLTPLVEPQLGAYSLASPEPCDMAAGVELHDDGTYKVHWGSRHPKRDKAQFNLGHAERVFLAHLSVFNFNKEHGLA